jgi:hypothetical protein
LGTTAPAAARTDARSQRQLPGLVPSDHCRLRALRRRTRGNRRCDAMGSTEGALVRAPELPRPSARTRHRARQPLPGALRARPNPADRTQASAGDERQTIVRADSEARLLRIPDRRPDLSRSVIFRAAAN